MVRPCPWCAEDISVLASACKYCGEDVAPMEPQAPVPVRAPEPVREIEFIEPDVSPRPAAPDVEFVENVKSVAWEDPSRRGIFSRWWSTWAKSQFSPTQFWREMPADRGHLKPIGYAAFLAVQALLFVGLPLFGLTGLAMAAEGEPAESYAILAGLYVLMFPAVYVGTALGTWVGAALWHLPLKVLGAKGGYQTTVRAIAYTSGAKVWIALPVLGMILAPLLSVAQFTYAFRHAHGMGPVRAFIGATLPWIAAIGAVLATCAVAAHSGGCY
jgi:hypothetical protein